MSDRNIIRAEVCNMISRLRSLASQLRAEGTTEDEEQCFNQLLHDFAHACKIEIAKLKGAEQAARILDPFSKSRQYGDTRKT